LCENTDIGNLDTNTDNLTYVYVMYFTNLKKIRTILINKSDLEKE